MRIIPPWEFNEEDYLRKKVEQIKRRAAMGLPIAWKRPLSELNPKTLKEFILKHGMTPYQHYLKYGRFEDIPGYGIPRRAVSVTPRPVPKEKVEIPYFGKFTKEQLIKAGMIVGGIILLLKLLK